MSIKRSISGKKYFLALILTLIVFSAGIGFGLFIEELRLDDAQNSALRERVSLRSLELQQQFIDSGTDCKTMQTVLQNTIIELEESVSTIQSYERNTVKLTGDFELQLQDYFLMEIQFYLLAKKIAESCPQEAVKILYFYDDNEASTQGEILGYLKKKFGEKLLIFSFDSTFEQEHMIKTLLTSYNIERFPAIVLEEKVFQGHQDVDLLHEEICDAFKKYTVGLPEECIN